MRPWFAVRYQLYQTPRKCSEACARRQPTKSCRLDVEDDEAMPNSKQRPGEKSSSSSQLLPANSAALNV